MTQTPSLPVRTPCETLLKQNWTHWLTSLDSVVEIRCWYVTDHTLSCSSHWFVVNLRTFCFHLLGAAFLLPHQISLFHWLPFKHEGISCLLRYLKCNCCPVRLYQTPSVSLASFCPIVSISNVLCFPSPKCAYQVCQNCFFVCLFSLCIPYTRGSVDCSFSSAVMVRCWIHNWPTAFLIAPKGKLLFSKMFHSSLCLPLTGFLFNQSFNLLTR